MYEYIKGEIIEINPTYVVVETAGIAYFINISLYTYSEKKDAKQACFYLHQIVRDDAHLLYGFATKTEREIFRLLISVSGVGSNTAGVMLSYLSPPEIKDAIMTENETVLKSVKGIGAKTAKRIILDLKDKIGKTEVEPGIIKISGNDVREEAVGALVMLGFQKNIVSKIVTKILTENPKFNIENVVKEALKSM